MNTTTYDAHALKFRNQIALRRSEMAAVSSTFFVPELLFDFVKRIAAVVVALLFFGIFSSLVRGALPAWHQFGISFLWTDAWNPVTEKFGALAPIRGTVLTALIAMAIAVPVGIGFAVFLTEICPRKLRKPIGILVELLAGIPSIVYGIWGLFVFAPAFQSTLQPRLIALFADVPFLRDLFAGPPYGIGVFTASLILSIMVLPFIAAISRDVFEKVPAMMKEAAYGIGCTKWEVVWHIVLPWSRRGVAGGSMLALGRALGETMAVTFVIGNAHHIQTSLFSPGTSISAVIANEFTEANDGIYLSSLLALGLILFVITFLILAIAHVMMDSLDARSNYKPGTDVVSSPTSEDMEGLSAARFNLSRSRQHPTLLGPSWKRRLKDKSFLMLSAMAAIFGLTWLGWILTTLFSEGIDTLLTSELFTSMTPPPGASGGLLNAIVGSVMMSVIAMVIGTVFGIYAGAYLADQTRYERATIDGIFIRGIRFVNDILLSTPSIIIGLFIYEMVVIKAGGFSGWAGSLALAAIVLPIVVRTTENALHLVPNTLLEAAASFGAPRYRIAYSVIWKAARAGILTGGLLALARISGETAPLLFTTLGNQFWSWDLTAPMASLPGVIYQFAMSPYENWHHLAWAGALLITLFVLILSSFARWLDLRATRRS